MAKRVRDELAELKAAQAGDAKLDAAGRAGRASPRAPRAIREDVSLRRADGPTLGDVQHRDVPKLGRKPKVRRGTERLQFRDRNGKPSLVIHAGAFETDDGPVDIHGAPLKEPADWADVAANLIVNAKLAVLSYLDAVRLVPEDQRAGIPDPRGPKLRSGESVEVSQVGAFVSRGRSGAYFGRAEAMPAAVLARLAGAGHKPPAWMTEPLIAWLIQLASHKSGGAGQLGRQRMVQLLREPDQLGRVLQGKVGRSRELRRIAMSLPRKRAPKSRA